MSHDVDTKLESLPAEALMASLLASSTEYAIIGQDLDGNILFWNEGARKLYGYDSDEVAHKPEAKILHPPEDVSGGRQQEVLKAALKDGKWEGTLDQVRKSGERFTARVVVTLGRDANANATGFLYISRDISSKSRLAEDLRKAKLFDPSIMGSARRRSISLPTFCRHPRSTLSSARAWTELSCCGTKERAVSTVTSRKR